MDFISYYNTIANTIDKRKLRNKIILACGVQMPTFYSWLRRRYFPKLVREKIGEILERPVNELFPSDNAN